MERPHLNVLSLLQEAKWDYLDLKWLFVFKTKFSFDNYQKLAYKVDLALHLGYMSHTG